MLLNWPKSLYGITPERSRQTEVVVRNWLHQSGDPMKVEDTEQMLVLQADLVG